MGGLPPRGEPLALKLQPIPSPLYVRTGDKIVLRSHNAVTSVRLALRARLLLPTGDLSEVREQQSPSATRAVNTRVFDLTEGYLLSVMVVPDIAVVRRGETFVTCFLRRGGAPADQDDWMLFADYITEQNGLGWPGGMIRQSVEGPGILRSVLGTDPAAGVEISETVPTNARWRLLGFRATLVTAVAAATRDVHLVIDDGTTQLFDFPAQTTQIASLTRNYNAAAIGYGQAAVDSEIYIPIAPELPMFQGWRVRTVTTSLQAADDWGAPQLMVEEWIED